MKIDIFMNICYNNNGINWGGVAMDVRIKDILYMKKPHPCGVNTFEVLRTGVDFRLRCTGCGREIMIPRSKAEKSIKRIERKEND